MFSTSQTSERKPPPGYLFMCNRCAVAWSIALGPTCWVCGAWGKRISSTEDLKRFYVLAKNPPPHPNNTN
jgi:hypothetical protein